MLGQGQENVVQAGAAHREAGDQRPARVGRVEQRPHLGGAALGRHAQRQAGLVAVDGVVGKVAADLVEGGFARAGQVKTLDGDPLLELGGGALGDDAPAVQYRDRFRKPFGLFQVLGGEEDGHPGRGQVPDHPPHGQPALRVQPGRRLVQEDHRRAADQAGGDVEAAAHPAGVGAHAAPRGRGQVELPDQLGRALPGLGPGQPGQPAHHPQVLLAGLHLVQRGELPGEADPAADLGPVAAHVEARHPGPPGVRLGERGQDAHGRGLARSVRPEQGEHAAALDLQVDAGEHGHGAVGLGQPAGLDGQVVVHQSQLLLIAYEIR